MIDVVPAPVEEGLRIAVALAIATVALCNWRFWSMRFWLIAAAFYGLLPVIIKALTPGRHEFGLYGTGRHAPPVVYGILRLLESCSTEVLLPLMGLGLLSFHPATRWVETARHRKTVLRLAALAAFGVAISLGWKLAQPAKSPPLDPLAFDREQISKALSIHVEMVQTTFRETLPQFRITLTNQSDSRINLSGRRVDGLRLRPEVEFRMRRRDGVCHFFGSALRFPQADEWLESGASRTIRWPELVAVANPYNRDWMDLLFPMSRFLDITPGDYDAYVYINIDDDNRTRTASSNIVSFRCRST